jgi:hypothetical protein
VLRQSRGLSVQTGGFGVTKEDDFEARGRICQTVPQLKESVRHMEDQSLLVSVGVTVVMEVDNAVETSINPQPRPSLEPPRLLFSELSLSPRDKYNQP